MKKLLLLTLLLTGLADSLAPVAAEAAPSTTARALRHPNQMARTRRRLRRQAAQRMRHNKRQHHA